MTTETGSSLLASLELFESFAVRLVQGLEPRIEGEVASSGAEISRSTRATVVQEAAGGALLGRTAWGVEGQECAGCFLWIGPAGALVGEPRKGAAELSDDEVETLDQSLRLNVDEGGEDDCALEWSALEKLGAGDVDAALLETGVAEECEVCRVPVSIQGTEMVFLFLVGAQETPSDEEQAAAQAAAAAVGRGKTPPEDTPSSSGPERGSSEALGNLQHLLDVRMPLTIRLGSTRMPLDEVLRLAPGSILELEQREDEPLEVLANGHVIAKGEVVVVDDRFGLRITEIGSSADRLRATL